MPDLLVAGSIALDSLEGPFGKVSEELGGSALYFSMAASLIGPVRIVAPVGRDGMREVRALLAARPAVDASGLVQVDAPTYRWSARAAAGRNLDLGSQDSIYDHWSPSPPEGFDGWAFVGSMRPDRQLDAARGLNRCQVLAADAMRSYVEAAPREARELLGLVSWYFCNAEEFRALGGDPASPADFRAAWALEGLVIKAGADGASAHTARHVSRVYALEYPVVDTTGAGDALAGGTLARWRQLGGEPDGLEEALRYGVACASIAIQDVGLRALARATAADVSKRVTKVRSQRLTF